MGVFLDFHLGNFTLKTPENVKIMTHAQYCDDGIARVCCKLRMVSLNCTPMTDVCAAMTRVVCFHFKNSTVEDIFRQDSDTRT